MSFSLNEVESLSRKAARGAGYDWGLAEEAGRAVRWLSSHALAGPEALAMLLDAKGHGQLGMPAHQDFAGAPAPQERKALCPIVLGAAICDFGSLPHAGAFDMVAVPLLLVPAIAEYARSTSQAVHVSAGGLSLEYKAGRVAFGANPKVERQACVTVRASPGTAGGGQYGTTSRARINAEVILRLTEFAHQTYAPATEASRLAGAGAGNDAD